MKYFTPLAMASLLLIFSCQKADRPKTQHEGNDMQANARSAKVIDHDFTMIQRCAAHEVLQRQIAANPDRGRRLEALERIIQEKSEKGNSGKGKPPGTGGGGGGGNNEPPRGLVTIPVYVHVLLSNADAVTNQQINDQLNVLINDFQAKNSELTGNPYLAGNSSDIVADCQISFTLAGVVRKNVNTIFGTNDAVKYTAYGGSDAESPESNLNMWVCDLSGGLLGYAQFPGGNVATDGVVIDYQAFGTSASYPMYPQFKKGRTATHEVGHWLNLRHIWGDSRCGNDYVDDTPPHEGANYGCAGDQNDRSFCKGRVSYDMWMNYMDYTDDACMYMFTVGQKARIDATLTSARSGYISSTSSPRLTVRSQ